MPSFSIKIKTEMKNHPCFLFAKCVQAKSTKPLLPSLSIKIKAEMKNHPCFLFAKFIQAKSPKLLLPSFLLEEKKVSFASERFYIRRNSDNTDNVLSDRR